VPPPQPRSSYALKIVIPENLICRLVGPQFVHIAALNRQLSPTRADVNIMAHGFPGGEAAHGANRVALVHAASEAALLAAVCMLLRRIGQARLDQLTDAAFSVNSWWNASLLSPRSNVTEQKSSQVCRQVCGQICRRVCVTHCGAQAQPNVVAPTAAQLAHLGSWQELEGTRLLEEEEWVFAIPGRQACRYTIHC
jgi:hypothetical protein